MDLREKKTRRSIAKAFFHLRKTKALERITVKELSELAEISKATFYLHYRDIYDLNEKLQEELLQEILAGITNPEAVIYDPGAFTKELYRCFYSNQEMIDILFSGNQAGVLPVRIEKELRDYFFNIRPDIDPRINMLLTYQIQGGFFVSREHVNNYGMEEVVNFISCVSQVTSDFFRETLDFSSSH